MNAAGGQRNDDIPRLHGGVVQNLALVHSAHGKARQVVLVLRVEAGHFGSLAAHQCTARLDAALGHALHDVGDALRHVFAAGNVIQKYQRFGAGADDVIDAHGHAVNAHSVMLVHILGDAQLGAHAVGAGNQNGMGHIGAVQLEQAAETAQPADAMLVHGAGHILFHQLHTAVTGGDVHTGGGVAGRIGFFHCDVLLIKPCRCRIGSAACRKRCPWSRWAGPRGIPR